MIDEKYQWRGTVIKSWARRGAEQWQAHRCHWFGAETWPFTIWELNRLILLRWLYERGRIHEDTVALDRDQPAGQAPERLPGNSGRFAGWIGERR